jgi:hypothetical protein
MFFSEEKNQKTFASARVHRCGTWPERWVQGRNKSLFVLFFRKEHTYFLAANVQDSLPRSENFTGYAIAP